MNFKLITEGTRFGRLTVGPLKEGFYECHCDCGTLVLAQGRTLRAGKKNSCGCLRIDLLKSRFVKPIEIGTIFGRLTVISWSGVTCRCRCSCGQEVTVRSTKLRQGKTKSCGCYQKDRAREASALPPITPGTVFGKLTVVGKLNQVYRCKCECGTDVEASARNLRRGHKKSCGCLLVEQTRIMSEAKLLSPGEAAFGSLLSFYRCQARQRELPFMLSKEEFRVLTSSPCSYCGSAPASVKYTNTGRYVYNGVDRVDNLQGYTQINCRAACWWCNRAKHTVGLDQFKDWITKISHFVPGLSDLGEWDAIGLPKNPAARLLLRRYRNTAIRKKQEFSLSDLQFYALVSSRCHYCGSAPERECDYSTGHLRYNGIDRIDNKRGYATGNVVAACFTCNNAKAALASDEFMAHVKKCFDHLCS